MLNAFFKFTFYFFFKILVVHVCAKLKAECFTENTLHAIKVFSSGEDDTMPVRRVPGRVSQGAF